MTAMHPYIYIGLESSELKYITEKAIIEKTFSFYRVSTKWVKDKSRRNEYVTPKQVAMHIIRRKSSIGLKEIGKLFDRHHSTVIHAIQTVDNLLDTDRAYKKKYNQLFELL